MSSFSGLWSFPQFCSSFILATCVCSKRNFFKPALCCRSLLDHHAVVVAVAVVVAAFEVIVGEKNKFCKGTMSQKCPKQVNQHLNVAKIFSYQNTRQIQFPIKCYEENRTIWRKPKFKRIWFLTWKNGIKQGQDWS